MFVFSVTVFADPANPTEEDAVAMVETTVGNLENDAQKTLKAILHGEDKYWPYRVRQFYVFVLDESATVIACPMLRFVGKNYKEIKDVEGKTYRYQTVTNALKNKEGWITFSTRSRGKIKKRKTYFKLFKDDKGNNYIVCCDIDEAEEGDK